MRIKWLHLSDIHFNYKNYNSKNLRDDFLERVNALAQTEGFTHLFLTGDILFQYNNADHETVDFINNLIQTMGLSLDHVIIIPGNHDHYRNLAISTIDLSVKNTATKTINKDLIDNLTQDETAALLSAFQKFENVYNEIYGHSYYNSGNNPHIFEQCGELSIIKINTAWLDQDSEDGIPLYCGCYQLQSLLSSYQDEMADHLNIAVGHHPLEDMAEEEADRLIDLFERNNIELYFCGHKHKPAIRYYHDHNLLEITAPGGYNDGYSEGGYVWGEIDTEFGICFSEIFIWDNGKWCIESRLKGTNERGILYFDTPTFKHKANITAYDLKLIDNHIARSEIEDSIGQAVDIHTYDEQDLYDWKSNAQSVEDLSDSIKQLIAKNEQVHLFPLAPIPTLIKLGFELQDNSKLFIRQYDRKTKQWVYDSSEDENIVLNCSEDLRDKEGLIVSISTSAQVTQQQISMLLRLEEYDFISFQASKIETGSPLYSSTVRKIAKEIVSCLDRIRDRYKSIHLFAAIPAGLAIEIGRNMLRSMYNNVYTYQFWPGRYEQAYIINPYIEDVAEDHQNVVPIIYNSTTINLPVVGNIACGGLSEAIAQTGEYLPFYTSILDSGNHFILMAKGDSMIDAGIEDGDLVLIHQQTTADDGQIVVALVDNETTLKRLFHDSTGKKIVLVPENKDYKNQTYENVEVQGVATMVIKKLK